MIPSMFMASPMLLDDSMKFDPSNREVYEESHRTMTAQLQDEGLPNIWRWLEDSSFRPANLNKNQYRRFVNRAKRFYMDSDERLYKKSTDGLHRLVVGKVHRMYMMRAAHDHLGHRGAYATTQLVSQRFWWPELERDVHEYVKTCHECQVRQMALIRNPPSVTPTPGLFQVLHADTMHMTPASNGCKYIVHGRCALSSWMEGRPLRKESARSVGQWLFEDIICRWGTLLMVVTDNGSVFVKAVDWLASKYGIKGIRITPYNSQANGKIERFHWDVRQSLVKATGGDLSKWFWFFALVMWADRITVRKGFGCSPYFITTGSHPILPLDVVEATWLVDYPDGPLATADLIGLRAKALAKHRDHVEDMRIRVTEAKIAEVLRFEREHQSKIKDYVFAPGSLVLVHGNRITFGSENQTAIFGTYGCGH